MQQAERKLALQQNPLFVYTITDQLKVFNPLHPEAVSVRGVLSLLGAGVRADVEKWMAGYRGVLTEVRAGVEEAMAHRNDMFLGDSFEPQHGTLIKAISLDDGPDKGVYGYELPLIATPDVALTFDHAYRLINQMITGAPKPWQYSNLQYIKSQRGHGEWTIINDKWGLDFRIDPKDKRSLFPVLRIALLTLPDSELKKLIKQKEKDRLREGLKETVDPQRVEERIQDYVRDDFAVSKIGLDAVFKRSLDTDEIVQAIVESGQWIEVTDEQEKAELAEQYPVGDAKIARLLRLTSEGSQPSRILEIYPTDDLDSGTSAVDVVISNSERHHHIEAFMQQASKNIAAEIQDGLAKGSDEADLSPRRLILDVLDEMPHDNTLDEELARLLFPETAILLAEEAPGEIKKFLLDLANVVEQGESIRVDPIGVIEFPPHGDRGWSVQLTDDLDIRIVVNFGSHLDLEKLD